MPVATVGARRSRRSLKGAPVAAVQVVPASGESVAREAAVKAVVKAESVDSRKRRPPARRAKVLTPAQQAALKKRRLELNRQAAVKSRKKKKEAIAGMKQALANMTTENKHLWDDNKLLNSAYAQLQGAYSKSFEDVVALRQNLNTMRNAFESLVSDLGGSAPDAVAKAKAKIAPAVEFLQNQQLAAGKRPQLSATQLPVAIVGGRCVCQAIFALVL